MKVIVENLGILKQAEFEVGDLTIICGANNTGKTYATYALYGFLTFWNEAFACDSIGEEDYTQLMKQGSIKVKLGKTADAAQRFVDDACEEYVKTLPMIFGAGKKSFSDASFRLVIGGIDVGKIDQKRYTKGPDGRALCEMSKAKGESFVSINITANSEEVNALDRDWFLYQLNRDIQCILFGAVFPAPFIASIERTGAAMFQKELDIYRNRLLEQIGNRDKVLDLMDLLSAYQDGRYALPVRRDVDFIRDLENVAKFDGVLAEQNPAILSLFDMLAGGEYRATKEGLYYIPDKSKTRLTMGESASSVRSLLNLGMYLRHFAGPGDFLMIDEPELNLHPRNQRLMARLLAKLSNAGIRVFITTHSDYILKEFNTLIMMQDAGASAKHIIEKYKYEEDELLDASRVRAYIAKKELTKIEGRLGRRQMRNTFTEAPIGAQGIEIMEFDETINTMNAIQEQLLYGEGSL